MDHDPAIEAQLQALRDAVARIEPRLAGFYAAVAVTAMLLIVVPGLVGLLRVLS